MLCWDFGFRGFFRGSFFRGRALFCLFHVGLKLEFFINLLG